MILKILFLFFNNANIEFTELEKLTWRFYTPIKDMLTINSIQFIAKKEFAKAILDKNIKTFIIYIVILKILTEISIHLFGATLITTVY